MLMLVRLLATLVVADVAARLFGYDTRRVTPVVTPAPEWEPVPCPCDGCFVKRVLKTVRLSGHQHIRELN